MCKMRLYSYFSILFFFGYQKFSNAEDISTYGIPDTINDLIETLREGIPDVIEISSVNVQLPENDYLTGYLNVNDGKITGIKEFNLSLTYNVISFPTGFALKLDPINVNLEYLTDLALFNIPLLSIFGEGTGSVAISNLTINGKIAFALIPKINLSVNSIHIGLGDAQITFNGLLNDETFSRQVNDLLTNNVAKLVNENENTISAIVENVINTILSGLLSNSAKQENYDNEILIKNGNYTREGIMNAFKTLVEQVNSMLN